MEIRSLELGPYGTNCYMVFRENGHKAWVIDPAADSRAIIAELQKNGIDEISVLLTHAHWDHIMGLPGLKDHFGDIEIAVGEGDQKYLGKEGEKNIRRACIDPLFKMKFAREMGRLPSPTRILRDGDIIEDIDFRVIATPGHTQGGVCYYSEDEKVLFSGDTLFLSSYGRCDLEGGDIMMLKKSLVRLSKMDRDIRVFPGHGPSTSIGNEEWTFQSL